MITTLNNTTGDVCNSLKRSQFAGRPWRSKYCELLLSSSLNCHFKPHPLLISSLPFPFFFFYGKLNLPEQCGPVFHSAARSFACRGEKPPAGTTRRPFLITEGQRRHPINCQEALKKKKSLKLIHRRQLSLSETGSRDNRV